MRASLFILLAVLLTACGQKGPLFLPESLETENKGVVKDNRESLQKKNTETIEASK